MQRVNKSKDNILVAMSGGVDSSVVAAKLHADGYRVIGVSLRLFNPEGQSDPFAAPVFDSCCSLDDLADARRVAAAAGFPHYTMDFESIFKQKVYDYFVDEYARGRTPNPCVYCNDFIKFDHLFDVADRLGCQWVATGHYATIRAAGQGGELELHCGADDVKDQSYFLFGLKPHQLARILFPLADMSKPDVRRWAEQARVRTAHKPESQDVCFVPRHDTQGFLDRALGPQRIRQGRIVDDAGRVLGDHGGIHRFTVGQRRGIGVAADSPLYVKRIDADSGDIVVARRAAMAESVVTLGRLSWTSESAARLRQGEVKIRYRTASASATWEPDGDRLRVRFDRPMFAPTPGQAAVLYAGTRVLGGGFIESVGDIGATEHAGARLRQPVERDRGVAAV